MKNHIRKVSVASNIFAAILLFSSLEIRAQGTEIVDFDRDTLISAAKDIMETTTYCALITLDTSGHPQVRTMDPFPPEDNMLVWLGTNVHSRKVGEIRSDSRVSLYYEAPNGTGYVVMQGRASIINDPENLVKYWKEEWDSFYPDKDDTYVLIKVVPERLEIVDYRRGIFSSSKTWEVPHVAF